MVGKKRLERNESKQILKMEIKSGSNVGRVGLELTAAAGGAAGGAGRGFQHGSPAPPLLDKTGLFQSRHVTAVLQTDCKPPVERTCARERLCVHVLRLAS